MLVASDNQGRRARKLLEDSDSTVAQGRDHVLQSRSEVVAVPGASDDFNDAQASSP